MHTHGFDVLLGATRARLAPEERWLDDALMNARRRDVNRLLGAYTSASRKTAGRDLRLTAVEHADIDALSPGLSCDRWTLDDLVRATILLEAARVEDDALAWIATASACYENGDAREQQSWLRAISLLPLAERFAAFAIDACRSHIQPTFEAIACENPYPATYFPDLQLQSDGAESDCSSASRSRASSACAAARIPSCRAWRATTRRSGAPPDGPCRPIIALALHDARVEEPVS